MNWTDALEQLLPSGLRDLSREMRSGNISKLAKQGLQRRYPQYSTRIGPVQPKPAPSLEARRMPYNIYGDQIPDEGGGYRPRRRGRGITARDLRSFRRVANLIRKYAAPVRHFRTHPKGHSR